MSSNPDSLEAVDEEHATAATSQKQHPSRIFPLTDFPPLEFFQEKQDFPALSVPTPMTAKLRKDLKHVLWHRPHHKNIYEDEQDKTRRILLLKPTPNDSSSSSSSSNNLLEDPVFQDTQIANLLSQQQQQSSDDCRKTTFQVVSTYDQLSVDEILRKLLPSCSEVPSAFESVGTLVHVNLRSEQLPYKYWIGKVLLDKHQPRIQTVVNKLKSIDTQFRTFGMEVIAGNDKPGWSEVTVKEEGCIFQLDFQQVYWNSRLAGEHRRLVQVLRESCESSTSLLPPQQSLAIRRTIIIADLMAGVGPFCVPLTATANPKKRNQHVDCLQVYANDLNPSSYKYLQINATANKCRNLKCYNMDARAFCRYLQEQENVCVVDHVLMNLPASAPEFLDAFRGWKMNKLPRLHVYCFGPRSLPEATKEAVRRCATALGCPLDEKEVKVRIVRDVSPNKNMLHVSFVLPEAVRNVAANDGLEQDGGVDSALLSTSSNQEPDAKKAKID